MADGFLLEGNWEFRSFFNDLDNPAEALHMGPWAPPGKLDTATPTGATVKATMTFAPGVVLGVTGWTTSGVAAAPPLAGSAGSQGIPPGVILKAEGLGAIYELRGFLAAPKTIVGTVRCVQGDLAKRADGTVGPFVLFQA